MFRPEAQPLNDRYIKPDNSGRNGISCFIDSDDINILEGHLEVKFSGYKGILKKKFTPFSLKDFHI